MISNLYKKIMYLKYTQKSKYKLIIVYTHTAIISLHYSLSIVTTMIKLQTQQQVM